MCYFTFITISTVGFGDYSPTTTFARIFIFFAVMGGVTFFSLLGSDILNIITHLASGKGKYTGAKRGRSHVLVMGVWPCRVLAVTAEQKYLLVCPRNLRSLS